jgi:hypothetical protein
MKFLHECLTEHLAKAVPSLDYDLAMIRRQLVEHVRGLVGRDAAMPLPRKPKPLPTDSIAFGNRCYVVGDAGDRIAALLAPLTLSEQAVIFGLAHAPDAQSRAHSSTAILLGLAHENPKFDEPLLYLEGISVWLFEEDRLVVGFATTATLACGLCLALAHRNIARWPALVPYLDTPENMERYLDYRCRRDE